MTSAKTEMPRCPRCNTATTTLLARSPVEAAWEMLGCTTCFYSWRSTEPSYATTREGIAPRFRIDPEAIAKGTVMPTVPPLRSDSSWRPPF